MREWLRDARRDLHAHPELSCEEHRTTGRVVETLTGLGWDTARIPGTTGAVGLLQGRGDGPVVALRADIDALPIAELNEVDYRSRPLASCMPAATTPTPPSFWGWPGKSPTPN